MLVDDDGWDGGYVEDADEMMMCDHQQLHTFNQHMVLPISLFCIYCTSQTRCIQYVCALCVFRSDDDDDDGGHDDDDDGGGGDDE